MMLHNNPAKKLIKRRKREKRRTVYKLPYLWWLLGILFAALGLLVVSYFTYKCAPWFSGALVSLSCGCFTGATFYFLVNIRTNKERKIQREYDAIKKTLDLLNHILDYGYYCRALKRMGSYEQGNSDDKSEILSSLDKIELARSQIDLSVYHIVHKLGYDPLSQDNIKLYRDGISMSNDEKSIAETISWICKNIFPAAEEMKILLLERENQLSFIRGKFL